MRIVTLFLALTLASPVPGSEVDWKEFESPDHSFTVHFPVDPNIEATAYQTSDGRSFGAHTYSVAQETGTFTITVAEVPGDGEKSPLVDDAVNKLIQDGIVKFDIQHRIRSVYGRQLGIAVTNGGYSYVAVFHHNNRLYQIEGKAFAAGGQAEVDAMHFQQSLDFP
jgi:hypothetical protein